MAKESPSSTLSPFRRFEALTKALFAVPKKEADAKTAEIQRKRRKQKVARTAGHE